MVAAIIISICSCVVCLKLCVWEISIAIVCLLLMHMFGFDSYCSITIAHRGECIIATIDCRLRFVCGEVEVWLFVWYAVSYDYSSRSTQTRVQIGFARLCACPTCTMRVRRDHRLCLYWCWWAVAIASPCIYVCVCVFFKFSSNPKCVQLAKSCLLCKIAKLFTKGENKNCSSSILSCNAKETLSTRDVAVCLLMLFANFVHWCLLYDSVIPVCLIPFFLFQNINITNILGLKIVNRLLVRLKKW